MEKLSKKVKKIQPIRFEGRTIARSFWGKGWCDHLESFSDYENRLPRGRTYVRNGSVCHLEIKPGKVEAIVSGSELYNIRIDIEKLKPAIWKTVRKECSGRIGSMLELLQGRLSDEVMTVVTDRHQGLFPQPGEIQLDCDCPDWAVMCKHVAAVLYGVGRRLDDRPELLFLLRGVDAEELIATEVAVPERVTAGDALDTDRLGDIFGIDLDTQSAPRDDSKTEPKRRGRPKKTAASSSVPLTPASAPAPAAAPRHKSEASVAPSQARRNGGVPEKVAVVIKKSKRVALGTPGKNGHAANGRAVNGQMVNGNPANGQGANGNATNGRVVIGYATNGQVVIGQATIGQATKNQAVKTVPIAQPTGKSVARLRQSLELTAAEFARRLGVTAASVHRWEGAKGRLNLQARPLAALAELQNQARSKLGITIS